MLTKKRSKMGLFLCLLLSLLVLGGCNKVLVSNSARQGIVELPPNGGCKTGNIIQINFPGPGKVMVTAHAMLGLKSHTQGQKDLSMLYISSQEDACNWACDFDNCSMGFSIPADDPSWTASSARLIPISLSRTFSVNGAGQATYYLNGKKLAGNGAIKIWAASLQAVFYPK